MASIASSFLGLTENVVQQCSRGFLAQFSGETSGLSFTKLKSINVTDVDSVFRPGGATYQAATSVSRMFSPSGLVNMLAKRNDGLPSLPIIPFDYEPKYSFKFSSEYKEIGSGSQIVPTKVLTRNEHPTIRVSFFLDISRAQEQRTTAKNSIVGGGTDNQTAGAVMSLFQTSASSLVSSMLGGLSGSVDLGIKPILDKYEACATSDFNYMGTVTKLPCVMSMGLWTYFIGYVTDLEYEVQRTNSGGSPTRAVGSFTFERDVALEFHHLKSMRAGLYMFQKALSMGAGDIVLENGFKLITSAVTGGGINIGA